MEQQFKKEFVDHLKTLVPDKINNLNLTYPKLQVGYCRFNKNMLDSVYLESLSDGSGNEIILKFDYLGLNAYEFVGIYYCPDTCNEYRFDKNLDLNAKYLKDVSILPKLSKEEKLRFFNIFCKWKKIDKALWEKREFITVWQVQKDGINVENPYLATHNELENKERYKIMYDIVDEANLSPNLWFCKADVSDDLSITKDLDDVYIIVGENHVDMPMGEFWNFMQHK